jgi:hypothetical protein
MRNDPEIFQKQIHALQRQYVKDETTDKRQRGYGPFKPGIPIADMYQ